MRKFSFGLKMLFCETGLIYLSLTDSHSQGLEYNVF